MTSTSSTAQDAASDVLDVVAGTMNAGVELVEDITPDLTEVVESAVDAVASTSKVAVRLSSKVLRFVARHPKEVLTAIAVVAVALGALGYFSKRSDETAG